MWTSRFASIEIEQVAGSSGCGLPSSQCGDRIGEVLEEFEIEHRLDRFQSPFLVITINHSDGCTAWRVTLRAGRHVYEFACNFCGSLKPQVALHSPGSLSMNLNNL
jgi:hypothetical protein